MQIGDHMEGFEKENAFNQLFREIRKLSPELGFEELEAAISNVAPSFVDSLFMRKKCIRRLRYIGCTWCSNAASADNQDFILGETYCGTSFNGGTYTIEGHSKGVIGCAYFEWLKD